jgi:dephospho-CoA kinase
MFVIGITGGIGSGKSTAAKIFSDRGVRVLDADEISRKVTGPGGRALDAIRELLGGKMFDSSGSLNRKLVAGMVFSDRTMLDKLSAVIHKYVFEEIGDELQKEREKGTKVIILDVPIPVQKGFLDVCNQVWVISADDDIRLDRARNRGITTEDARRRMDMQMTREEYEDIADIIIENNEDVEALTRSMNVHIVEELEKRGIRI